MKTYLLPVSFKAIGLTIFALAYIVPIMMGVFDQKPWTETEFRRDLAQAIMLVGLLIVILSREKIEDEFISSCRLRAFSVAFIAGIIYYLLDAFGSSFSGDLVYSAFYLLIYQIGIYCFTFYFTKSGWSNGK